MHGWWRQGWQTGRDPDGPGWRPWIGAFNSPIIDSSWADTEGWRYNSIGPRIKLEKAML